MPKQFQGHIDLDVRDSTPDWSAFLADRAPQGAPNVLVVLYDDTGCAAWSPYGGRINMPTMQRLADNGLTYSQWHTTALCSPTRSTFITGRNHHLNGFVTISTLLLLNGQSRPTSSVADHVPGAPPQPGLLVFRLNSPLMFINAKLLRDRVRAELERTDPPVRLVLLDLQAGAGQVRGLATTS